MRISDWSSDVCSSDLIARNILSNRLSRLVDHGIMAREVMAEDRRKVRYQLTQKGIELLPAMIALRQWGEKWGAGVPSTPVLVDARDEQPIGPVTITAHDGRAPGYGELMWKHRSELQPLGQARQRSDTHAAPVAAERSEGHTSELQSLMRTSYAG